MMTVDDILAQHRSARKRPSEEELRLLRLLWPGSSREAVLAALPDRTWRGISGQAHRLKMRRKITRQPALTAWRPWTPDEEEALRAMYESGVPVTAIADALGRSMDGIEVRASRLKLERPKLKQTEVFWQVDNHNAVEGGSPGGVPGSRGTVLKSQEGAGNLGSLAGVLGGVPLG